jgi:muramoyltetrapeptide carboxypeptidase
MQVIAPKALKKGGTIGLVSPSEPIREIDRFERGKKVLEELGFNVVVGKNVFRRQHHMAGSDRERADDINEMFADRNIHGIIATTGGYSSSRVLPYLDYETIRKNPKVFLGLSDITVLLNAIFKKTKMITFHGPCLLYGICDIGEYTKKCLIRTLMEPKRIGVLEPLTEWRVLKEGKATGRLLGGNSSSVRNLIGTEYEPDWTGAIFFWEAFMKEPHYLDRELVHFKQAGIFEKINGMVVGKLNGCVEKEFSDDPPRLEELILEHCGEYDIPILYSVDFGHACENLTLPVGATVKIDTATKTLAIEEECTCE